MDNKTELVSLLQSRIQSAVDSGNSYLEANLKLKLNEIYHYSDKECRAFKSGMDFQKNIPNVESFGTTF